MRQRDTLSLSFFPPPPALPLHPHLAALSPPIHPPPPFARESINIEQKLGNPKGKKPTNPVEIQLFLGGGRGVLFCHRVMLCVLGNGGGGGIHCSNGTFILCLFALWQDACFIGFAQREICGQKRFWCNPMFCKLSPPFPFIPPFSFTGVKSQGPCTLHVRAIDTILSYWNHRLSSQLSSIFF